MRAEGNDRPDGQLTSVSFAGLLTELGPDPAGAGLRYERLRGRLIIFFLRRLVAAPEDLADQVIDRLARRLARGETVASIEGYALGIARLLLKEEGRLQAREAPAGNFLENAWADPATTREDALAREKDLVEMEACLAQLPVDEMDLLTKYHVVEAEERIARRRQLAETLGVAPAVLRGRIFSIVGNLRRCMEERRAKLEDGPPPRGKGI